MASKLLVIIADINIMLTRDKLAAASAHDEQVVALNLSRLLRH